MSTHRTPDDRLAQMEALATDPDADWDTLHWIAENYPSLRPAVASNPGTYPELLEALAAMNDPRIAAALARRQTAPEAEEELTGELSAEDIEDARVQGGGVQEGGIQAGAAPAFLEQQLEAPEPHEVEELPSAAGPDDAGSEYAGSDYAEPPYAGASNPAPVYARTERRRRRRGSRTPKLIVAVLLPVVALVAIGVLIFALMGDSGEQVAEEPAPAPAEEQGQGEENGEEEPEEGTGEEEGADVGADLEATRTDLLALPDDSACQTPDEDADVVAAFVESAAAAEALSEEAQSIEDVFADLQDSCDAVHAAAVYENVRSGGDDDVSASFEAVGTGWADPLMSADDAQEMDAFVTPDENIHCVFEDGVTCTVLDQTGGAPAGCDDGATFTMQVDGDTPGLDCDNEVSPSDDHDTLQHDSTATDGFLACVSLDDRISCWNTLTGVGFEMSEGDHYSYSP